MPLFPPSVPVTILVDGRLLAGYVRAYSSGARIFAPVDPLLTRLADRIWVEGDWLVLQRGSRLVRVALTAPPGTPLDGTMVAIGPVLRALGASLRYDAAGRRLLVRLPHGRPVVSPTPFDPAQPSAAPAAIFTPDPPVTPRPVWTGSPLPRRTPLPLPPPLSRRARGARAR